MVESVQQILLLICHHLSLLSGLVSATMLFKPHFDGKVKWTSHLQVLRSATHKLLKKSYWTSFSTNGKQSWLRIAELCVQASLSSFGLPFSELHVLHAVVIFAKLEVIQFHVVMFLPATETKMLGKYPSNCVHQSLWGCTSELSLLPWHCFFLFRQISCFVWGLPSTSLS